jgi:hypothetical protein
MSDWIYSEREVKPSLWWRLKKAWQVMTTGSYTVSGYYFTRAEDGKYQLTVDGLTMIEGDLNDE